MGIFNKKAIKDLPPLLSTAEIEGANYDQVLDFLVSVNDADFDKIIKVAGLYRKTHCDVADVTGLKLEAVPSIFETQTVPPQVVGTPIVGTPGGDKLPDTEAGDFLADDDLANAFLDDTEKPATVPTKVEVKTDQGS